ncbi:gamma-aminobutyric acid receptor-associated protein-like [Procambarus clarkii]|uniref:gamma-aminobutyric acid receptor-associated protein-like n=1 Tax=Procambarus clarkii TaxID=6728 RepID=UPI003744031C
MAEARAAPTLPNIEDCEWNYKVKLSIAERKAMAEEIIEKYPDSVPVVIGRRVHDSLLIRSRRLIIPKYYTCQDLLKKVRSYIGPPPPGFQMSIHIEGVVPPDSATIKHLYLQYHENDGHLYVINSLQRATPGQRP